MLHGPSMAPRKVRSRRDPRDAGHDGGVPEPILLPDDTQVELPDSEDGFSSSGICRLPNGSIKWQALPQGVFIRSKQHT